ncbi:MAG TPA: hypothetical protein VGX96_19070 [Candidatus Elarobacter sp.]|jgi:hypothetical protein|nr:hypothetical protein [Candidatus Elarobacter sp.]
MRDPLSKALDEAPEVLPRDTHPDVESYRTDHAPPLGRVLDALREQLIDAMSVPFFDGGSSVETTPVTKRLHSEAGGATIVARKREPAYEATVDLQVRSDHDEPADSDGGRYQVAAHAHLRCDDARGPMEREVEVVVREIDGTLQLDVLHLRAEMAAAILAIGKSAETA